MIYKEFDLPPNHPLIINLNKMLDWIKSSDISNRLSGKPEPILTKAHLQKRIANEISNNCYMARFDHVEGFDHDEIQRHSELVYEEQTGITKYISTPVAKTWYPENGWLGWHIDDIGGRLYSTWADGESYFRYQDPITKEIVTSYDKPNQWTFRIFEFNPKNPLWHCVHAKDVRVSVGYRYVRLATPTYKLSSAAT